MWWFCEHSGRWGNPYKVCTVGDTLVINTFYLILHVYKINLNTIVNTDVHIIVILLYIFFNVFAGSCPHWNIAIDRIKTTPVAGLWINTNWLHDEITFTYPGTNTYMPFSMTIKLCWYSSHLLNQYCHNFSLLVMSTMRED